MNSNINLLERRKKRVAILQFTKLRLLRTIAVSLLFLVSTLSVILFMLIAFSPLPQLKRQEQNALLTLSQSRDAMVKLALVNERAETIEKILKSRKSFDTPIEAIQTKLPAGVSVETLRLDKNIVTLTVSSKSVALLDTFINNLLLAVQQKTDFSKITLTSLSLDNQTSVFLLSLSVVTR